VAQAPRAQRAGAIQRAWARRGPLACILWPVSVLFGALAATRRALYRAGVLRATRLAVPVVVVGNVVAGGAGKTPVTIALLQHLRLRGIAAGVVSRGHGRSTTGVHEVLGDSTAAQVGDEPLLIHRATGAPVFVGARRADAARALLAAHPQTRVVLCDDGLQHLALARDVEICVFDDRGTGNGWLLPAGPLREPWPRRVDLVLHTGAHPAFGGFRARRSLAAEAVRADGTRRPLADLGGASWLALAGIAQPEAFFAMLRDAGVNVGQTLALPDHYDFDSGPGNLDAPAGLICTEKDAVKLWRARPDAWAVPLHVTLDARFTQALDALVDAKLSSRHGPETA